MAKGKRGPVAAWVAFGVGVAVTAGVAAERAWVWRDRRRADPYADEPYGTLGGKPLDDVVGFDGTRLHVEEIGAGPAVVLVHGFSLSLMSWHHQIQDLSADVRLILYDHRGHGRSGMPPSEDWSLDALAKDLRAVIRQTAKDQPVVLVGHSMGGMAAIKYCELFGEDIGPLVKGIVLIDTTAADVMGGILPGFARRIEATLQGLQEAAMRAVSGRRERIDRLRHRAPDLAYLGTRLMGFGPQPSPRQVDFVQEMLADTATETWLKVVPAITALDVDDALPAIDVPVLVMVGMHDRLTPMHAAERIAAALPDAELIVIPGAGHMPMLERHELVTDHLRRFIGAAFG